MMGNKGDNSRRALVEGLKSALADHFALYIKTKSFHWHLKGPRFRDRHLLFDEQATAILAVTDPMAERARKIDAETLTSIGAIAKHARISDQNSTSLDANTMISELHADNSMLVEELKALKKAADDADDNATSALVDEWQDEAERRVWFLRQEMS